MVYICSVFSQTCAACCIDLFYSCIFHIAHLSYICRAFVLDNFDIFVPLCVDFASQASSCYIIIIMSYR